MGENEIGLMQRSEESDIRTMVAAVKNRLAAVRELMKSELKKDRDYGVIPGTKKNVLLLPGAEKIALMFQFAPGYQLTHTDLPGGHRECFAVCTLTHAPTGRIIGQMSGSASTMEAKHRYRGASGKTCPKCEAIACKASKKEFGGGYYCDSKAGGCGERFKPGSDECKALDELPTTRQENPDPADQWNTVIKIAQKRAYTGAVKCASAASEIFTVDLEDAQAEDGEPPLKPVDMPTEIKNVPKDAKTVTGIVDAVSVKESPEGAKKPWKKYGIKIGENWYATFDSKIGAEAVKGDEVDITYATNEKGYHDIITLVPVVNPARVDVPGSENHLEQITQAWADEGLPQGALLTLLRKDGVLKEHEALEDLNEKEADIVFKSMTAYIGRARQGKTSKG